MMKYFVIAAVALISACTAPMDSDLAAHLEAERDFHAHMVWRESVFEKHDPEYISDCFHYELDCGIE
jgi:hypothetical protein